MATQNKYNYTVIRQFALMAMVWGVIGMAIGVWIAAELAWPSLNLGIPWLTFSRLRPLHTNLVILAFAGNVLFASSYYVAQHTCQTRLYGDRRTAFTFWGWQLAMVLAVITIPMGMTSGKEYAELEWPIDILITVVWLAYASVFFGTLARRKTPYIDVANWFFSAYIIATAVLHLVNSAALPVSLWPMKSYSFYPGAIDAMVTWWYGHGLVGFFLPMAFLGTMYYFLPQQVARPLYSYRLAAVHFWALIVLALWSAPQHLLYTALPDGIQSLGVMFAVLLWLPCWGGLINGVMTIVKNRAPASPNPIVRFFVVALLFYGLATLEGPIMALRSSNAITHYTDLTIGHAHTGGLGWIGFLAIGVIYALVPQIYHRERMYSQRLIVGHFWLATLGVILYLVAMGSAGVKQSMMWSAANNDGTLTYRFLEATQVVHDFYVLRVAGGALYLLGMILMLYNVWQTTRHDELHLSVASHAHWLDHSHHGHDADIAHADHANHMAPHLGVVS